jgi:type IV pilus assembly protein PilW
MLLNKQRGVSLVEMMVAITIGLILLAGVLSIFFSSKVTYFSNEKMARLQENGRVALNLISHDVRAASNRTEPAPTPRRSPCRSR